MQRIKAYAQTASDIAMTSNRRAQTRRLTKQPTQPDRKSKETEARFAMVAQGADTSAESLAVALDASICIQLSLEVESLFWLRGRGWKTYTQ
jgi:hypothetical protein